MKYKTKNITKFILVAVVVFLCMPVLFVSAKQHEYDSASVTTTSANPYSKVAITPQSSMFSSVQISGNNPGTFTLQDWAGATLATTNVPDVAEAELYYPVTLGSDISYQNGYGLISEFNTYYVNVANNSDKFGEYEVSLVVDRYKIGDGDSVEIQLDSGIIPEVEITADRQGIYQIWYNNIALTFTIVSPSGKTVSVTYAQLPDHQFGGTTMGRYAYFAAFEIGKYKMTFTTAASTVNLRLEYFKSKTIRSGTSISDGVIPGSSEILNPEYQKYVYELSIDLLNYYVYSVNFDFNDPGSANRRIFYETASASTSSALSTGNDRIYSPAGGAKIYIVIDTPDYFTWPSPGVAESNVPRFSLEFNEVKSDKVDFGESELLVVNQQEFAVGRYVRTRKAGVFSFLFESVGPASPNLIHGEPYLQEIVDNQVATPLIFENVYASGGNYSVNVMLSKGTYKFGFYHTGSAGNEYLRLTTEFTEADDTSIIVKNPANPLSSGQFRDVTLSAWSSFPDTDGSTHGNALLWDIDESWRNFGYNVTFNPAKNGQIFDVNLAPDLEFLLDATTPTFVDYTGASTMPMKTGGGTVGDAFIIGAFDKFKGVEVSLGSASDTDAFTWQYRSSGGWLNFVPTTHDFIDGTRTGSGSLQNSGTVTWDPDSLTNWNYVQTTSNNTGTGIPDTDNQRLYLIRILCNNSAASIPQVNNFSLKKFVKIQFDLNLEMGYDVGPLGDPFYAATSGELEWSGGTTIDNAQDPISLDDSNFGLNYNFNYETALLFLSTEDMLVYNYNGSNTGVTEKLTANMVFSVAIYRINDWIQQEYELGKDAPPVHSADVNFSTVAYGHTLNYNASDLVHAYVKLIPARRHQYDWTQFTLNVSGGTVNSVNLCFPSSLTSYTLRSDGSYMIGFTGTEQFSSEFGFVTEYILLEFDITATTTDGMVEVKLYAGHFGYPMITFDVSSFVWTWYYTVGAVGLAVIVGGVVAFFLLRKKKRGF